MPQQNKLQVTLELVDNFSKQLSGVTQKAQRTTGSIQSGFQAAGREVGRFTTSMVNISKNAGAAAVSVGATVMAVTSLGEQAGKVDGLRRGFNRLYKGGSRDLDKLRDAAKGTISDFDLMQSANRAALLGVTTNVDELSGLMVTARLRGREMGLTTTQAFEDIVTGIGRGSPLILDNLGIKIPDALKKTMEGMTEAEKTQALLNFAVEDGAKIAEQYGGDVLTAGDRVAQFQADLENMRVEGLEALAPAILTTIDGWKKVIKWTKNAAKEVRKFALDVANALESFGVIQTQATQVREGQLARSQAAAMKRATEQGDTAIAEGLLAQQMRKTIVRDTLAKFRQGKTADQIASSMSNAEKRALKLEDPRMARRMGLAKGGIVPRYLAGGGMIQPMGTDTVPAMLTPGEAVMSREAVQKFAQGKAGNTVVNINLNNTVVTNDVVAMIAKEVQRVTGRESQLNSLGII